METTNIATRMVNTEDWDFYFVDGSKVAVTVNLDKNDMVDPQLAQGIIFVTYRDEEGRNVTEGSCILARNLLYYSKRPRKIPYVAPQDTPVAKELARLKALQDEKLKAAGIVTH